MSTAKNPFLEPPTWFLGDDKFDFFNENGIEKIRPFKFLDHDGMIYFRSHLNDIQGADCLPVCFDNQLNEYIAWHNINGRIAIIRAPMESDHVEIFEEFDNFWSVIDYIITRMKEYYAD